jgi:glycosyltransferase involved in cell wall biosynthesis
MLQLRDVKDDVRTEPRRPRIAVVIPCYNEALTIGRVVEGFKRELPQATIFVYDNNSKDDTARIARNAGAIVRTEKRQGKGFVVASMFQDVEADIFVMVDGDDTYFPGQVTELMRPVLEGRADMTVGNRFAEYSDGAFRNFHVFGNRLVMRAVNWVFGSRLKDIMSGYRVFGRRFINEVPIVSRGFEIETEMTLQALYRDMKIVEVPIKYGVRPQGSHSKLNTYRDGARVVLKIFDILKAYRPLLFFGMISLALLLVGLGLGSIPVLGYLETGKVERFPTAILAASLVTLSMLTAVCGLILDGMNHRMRELSRLMIQTRR